MHQENRTARDTPDAGLRYAEGGGLERVGVVDVGSNSVRLVVFDGAARSPAYFFNEKILCGLGRGVVETGRLDPEGRARTMRALRRFVALADAMHAAPLFGVATAAVREAADGRAFCDEVHRETGLALRIASGEEEARLSAQGVLLGWPGARGLMCDIGGSSMELAELDKGEVGRALSAQLGPLRLAALGTGPALDAEITAQIGHLRGRLDGDYERLFLVGGSWRAIARLDMERRAYPLKVLHEYALSPQQALRTVDWIAGQEVADMQALTGSSLARMQLVPVAARVLRALVEGFTPGSIAVSSYGIREGMLYERMPADLRRRDPLIEACRYMERASARYPGFGAHLFDFLSPLFSGWSADQRRLAHAACLLHDVTWRAHPDYRAEVCFDNATRSNLGGLDHGGRMFLGTALLYRYKNGASTGRFADAAALLDDAAASDARMLGRAMRFGAMLTGAQARIDARLDHDPEAAVLELVLSPGARDLMGEVVMTRFQSLARSLGCAAQTRIAPATGD